MSKFVEIMKFTEKQIQVNIRRSSMTLSRRFEPPNNHNLSGSTLPPLLTKTTCKKYLLALKEKFDSFIPNYEDISKEVNNAAQFEADNNEYADFTHSLFLEIQSKITDGMSFNEAISSHKLDIINCDIFSLSKPLKGNFSREIMNQMYNAQEGFVTAINSAEGVIISYLLKREMDENSSLDEQRQEITAQLRQQKTLELFRNRKQNIINEAVIEIF